LADRPVVVISRCIDFDSCRYNGQLIRASLRGELEPHVELRPICPELEIGLGLVKLVDPAQGGGAMLDLGVYLVSFAQHFLGVPDQVYVNGSLAPTGVDAEAGLLLGYDDGRAASVLMSLRGATPGAARIQGTDGWIDVPPRFHHPHGIVLRRRGQEAETFIRQPSGTGYSHELVEVTECIRAGSTESAIMPLDDTLAVQRILNEACEALGVVHHEDTTVSV